MNETEKETFAQRKLVAAMRLLHAGWVVYAGGRSGGPRRKSRAQLRKVPVRRAS